MPDGTVNGTTDDTSIYTVLQRTTVGIGQVKIQTVATCHYLCMAGCGLLYGSKDFGDDCVFRETIEQQSNYNTYCSRKYSTSKRTFYLALNRKGQSRKAVVRFGNQLGKLASFVRVLTRNVPDVQLANMREHIHSCKQQATDDEPKSNQFQRCPKKKRRKKKPQSCLRDSPDSQHCQKRVDNSSAAIVTNCDKLKYGKKCVMEEKFKIDVSNKMLISDMSTHKIKNGVKQKNGIELTETSTTALPTNDAMENVDEDYVIDPSVHVDWEGSTLVPSTTQVPKAQVV